MDCKEAQKLLVVMPIMSWVWFIVWRLSTTWGSVALVRNSTKAVSFCDAP